MSDAKLLLVRFELLALRLYVYGLEALDYRVAKGLLRSSLWLETRNLLRRHGLPPGEIAELSGRHPKGCACWGCVIALNRAVNRSVRKTRNKRN